MKSPILIPGGPSDTARQPQKFNNSLVRDITSKAFAVKTAFSMLDTIRSIRHTKGCFHWYYSTAVPISARPRSAVYDNARRCPDCAQMRRLDPPSLAVLLRSGWLKADFQPVEIVIVFPQVAGTGDKKGVVWIEVEVRRVFNLIL